MIGRMRRGKASVLSAMVNQESESLLQYVRIIAGSYSAHTWLYDSAADEVGCGDGGDPSDGPYQSLFAAFYTNSQEYENIQGNPEHRFPKKRQHCVEDRVGGLLVDDFEQPPIKLQKVFQHIRMRYRISILHEFGIS
jgi:hypothetical protein